jgi:riboflavin kinase / FMN adenylyltransferase
MKIYRSFDELRPSPPRIALAIGNFDGLHLGHQKILRTLVREAGRRRLGSCVLTFSPHPEKTFGTKNIHMLQTLEQRLDGLRRAGVQSAFVAPFDRRFADLSARAFAEQTLHHSLNAAVVVGGASFRFGKGRQGDLAMLKVFGREYGFEVRTVAPVIKRGGAVSSSRIRALLRHGAVSRAAELLGHSYTIEGDVIAGDRRGRSLGFPTANVETPNEIVPSGVFVTLFEVEGKLRPSVTNVGLRPTFARRSAPTASTRTRARGKGLRSIETFILDFDRKLYSVPVRVHFLKKIREERAFRSPANLVRQIGRDVAAAGKYFENMV